MLWRTGFVATLLVLSACGYHLRGTSGQDFNLAQIDFSIASALEDNQMERILARQWALLVSGADPVSASKSNWQIRLLKETLSSRGVMRGIDGRANQFELTLVLDYQWVHAAEASAREPETIQMTRSYYQPSNDLVGNQAQQNSLLSQMRQELSERLLHQLATLSNNPVATVQAGERLSESTQSHGGNQ